MFRPFWGHFHADMWRILVSVNVMCILYFFLTCLLTHTTQQSPSWEANRFAASQEILHILPTPMVYYRIHKFPSLVPTLRQLSPVHITTSHFLKFHLNIMLPSMPVSPLVPFVQFFPQKPCTPSLLPIGNTFPQPNLLDFITRTIFGEQYSSLSFSLCSLSNPLLPRPS
jgi:hypothetical protein